MSKKVKAYYEGMMSDDPKISNDFSFGGVSLKSDKFSAPKKSRKKVSSKAEKSSPKPTKPSKPGKGTPPKGRP